MNDERSVQFFELLADSSVFAAAFSKAKSDAVEFAAAFKASSASVEADASKMGLAIERGIATGQLSRERANALIGSRLQFYGAAGGSAEAGTAGVHESGMNLAGMGSGIFMALGIVGALAGAGAALASMVSNYANFSAQVLRNSEAIGINAQELQTWERISKLVGIGEDQLVTSFERFAKNLAEGAPQLKATGFTLKDLGITTTDVGRSILQLADYFHTHNDQAQKAAIAIALFGRSGAELIPILDQGSQAFKNYQAELQKMGVLLSNSQLFAGAQAKVALEQFSEAFEGAKNRFLGAVLPGFTAFFQQMSSIIAGNMPLWQQLGQVVGQVVMFIAGVVAGLTGSTINLSKAVESAGGAYQGLGGAARDAAAGVGSAGDATKDATAAIDAQIWALREQKRAYDDVAEAQKSALQGQLDALKDVTDHQRHQGENLISYRRRLEQVDLQDKIRGIDQAKTLYDRQVDEHIAALEHEKAAVKTAAGAMGADLAAGIGTGMAAGIAASDVAITKIQQQWVDAGVKYGQWVVTFFTNPSKAMTQAADTFGQVLGSAIAKGLEREVSKQIGSFLHAPDKGINASMPEWLLSFLNIPNHGAGGLTRQGLAYLHDDEVVLPMRDRSRSLSLMEQSGMASLARGAGGGGGGQGDGLTVNINGPVYAADPTEVARLFRELQSEARRRGFALSRGFG